jgi:hypothetical protein
MKPTRNQLSLISIEPLKETLMEGYLILVQSEDLYIMSFVCIQICHLTILFKSSSHYCESGTKKKPNTRDQAWRELLSQLNNLKKPCQTSSLDPRFRQAHDQITAQMYEDPAYTRADQIAADNPNNAALMKAILFESLICHGDLAERNEASLESSLSSIISNTNVLPIINV